MQDIKDLQNNKADKDKVLFIEKKQKDLSD